MSLEQLHDPAETYDPRSPAGNAILSWHGLLSELGSIGEDANHQGGPRWSFRSIRTTMNIFAPLLRKHELVPQLRWEYIGAEREGNTNTERVLLTLSVTSIIDGSTFMVAANVLGSAADTQDKAGGKAMSYALKAALLQGGIVPTEDGDLPDPDYDAPYTTQSSQSNSRSKSKPKPSTTQGDDDIAKARRAMFAKLKDLDVPTEKDARLAYCSEIIGRKLPSSNDMTLDEIKSLNTELQKRIKTAAKDTK